MDGFWLVQFTGVQGFGAGVLTAINGRLFGGDSSFLYVGDYTQEGNALHVRVHVSQHTPGQNVMGRNNFDLDLNGTVQGTTVNVNGTIPGTEARLTAVLRKQGDLPPLN